ncbi:MAG TPA: hypothetical protein VGR14_15430 [Verrucomicrobiae bacterium]|jgi:hypothetical protein|nr:hypothetical protein [Verrucomicrobiae bacterium]
MKPPTDYEPPLPRNDGAKSERIDLGLALLSALAPRRAALTPIDIAAWCGCTPAMISSIEARAMRRMKQKVRAQFKVSPFDVAERRQFLARHFRS